MQSWLTRGIGKVLKEKRIQKGWRLSVLAGKLGITNTQIVRIESGRVDISIVLLESASSVLGTNLEELMTQVVANDDERILLVGKNTRDLESELSCSFREIIPCKEISLALAALKANRFDCIVVKSEIIKEDVQVQKLISAIQGINRFRAIGICLIGETQDLDWLNRYCDLPIVTCTLECVKSAVEKLLVQSSKGFACRMRRLREELGKNRENLRESRLKLEKQRLVLAAQVRRLSVQQLRLASNLARPISLKSHLIAKDFAKLVAQRHQVAELEKSSAHYDFVDRKVTYLIKRELDEILF